MPLTVSDIQGEQRQPRFSAVDRRNILLCIALFLLAVAATNPVFEMSFNDDWSYAQSAREFALNGQFTYNGWGAPMLLPQIVWSALFIKLFGFSFLVMRLSTVVLGVFFIPVLYDLGRQSGLAPPFAVFATLLTALSPLVLPLTVSFMSDVPALFLFTLCLYCGVRSWKAGTTKSCVAWGALTALAGALGGLDRQVYWPAPILFLPVIAWVKRSKKGAVVGLGLAWLLTILAAAYCAVWFREQPYTISEHTLDYWKHPAIRHLVGHTGHLTAMLGMTAGLILLPLLVGYAATGFKTLSRMAAILLLVGALAAGAGVAILHQHNMPSKGNIVTKFGILPPGLVVLGARPEILGWITRDLLTIGVIVSCAGCGLALWRRRGKGLRRLLQDPAAPALVLGGVFASAWIGLLLFHSANASAFDRYVIPVLPLAGIPLLRHYQVQMRPRVSGWSWTLLALFGLYSVMTTHDLFAASRARAAATRALEQTGIPRREIVGGFEYDAWTQVNASGYVNEELIENPRGAFRPVTCSGPLITDLWYLPKMPAIHARYFVFLARFPQLEDGPVGPVDYTTWLPPARRQAFTQVIRGGGYTGCW